MSAAVTFCLKQSCVCKIALQLTKGHLSESQDPLDIDQKLRTAVLNVSSDLWQLDVYTWQARQILVTESCLPVMPWDEYPTPLVHVADSHGSGWSQSTTVTFGLNRSFVCSYSCLCVCLCK